MLKANLLVYGFFVKFCFRLPVAALLFNIWFSCEMLKQSFYLNLFKASKVSIHIKYVSAVKSRINLTMGKHISIEIQTNIHSSMQSSYINAEPLICKKFLLLSIKLLQERFLEIYSLIQSRVNRFDSSVWVYMKNPRLLWYRFEE